ncbi:MAG: glycosyltransferase family 39 protein [Chthonomonadales bacterium]|nr:glycosyltransferase family 39 protein [Chthonomonadales bacterium]
MRNPRRPSGAASLEPPGGSGAPPPTPEALPPAARIAAAWRDGRLDWLPIAALCSLCFLARLGAVGLFDFNEGLYVQAAREMLARHDYVTARVNTVPFFDKPPLALWLDVMAFRLLGVTPFAARIPVALAAAGLVMIIWWFGRRYFGRWAGMLASAMLALSPMYLGTARQMTMDIHQSLWVGAAMLAFYEGYRAGAGRGKRWYWVFWASCALAFLAKSVPGLLPLLIVPVFIAWDERLRARAIARRLAETRPLLGALLMAAIILPWFLLAWRDHGPSFWHEFFWLHHVKLLNATDFDHAAPVWYYVPALAAGFFPWSLFLPWAIRWRPVTVDPPERASARRMAQVWAAVVFLFFTGMKSKLVSYLLPMYPAVALLVGEWGVAAMVSRRVRGVRAGATLAAVVGAAGLFGANVARHAEASGPRAESFHRAIPPPVEAYIMHALALVAVGLMGACALAWLGRRGWAIGALVATMTALTALSVVEGLTAFEVSLSRPLRTVARAAARRAREGVPLAIYIGRPRHPSVFFELPVAGVEPVPGAEPGGGWLETGERAPVERFLAAHRPAYVLTDSRRASELIADRPDVRVERRAGPWVLLRVGGAEGG